MEHCEELIEELHELDFEVDGLVLKVNSFDQRERLGYTSKSPRWMIAYKFEKFEAPTKLLDIRVSVGKSGAVTPFAELEPVTMAGSVIRRASLHNADEIERKDCRVGDIVVVEKAGKVIPHIVRTEKHERKGRLEKFHFPTNCPECNTKLVKDPNGVYIRCPNLQCPAQVQERIRYYATRNAMDIEGLGDKLVEQLVQEQLVTGYGDLYRLTLEQLTDLERMGKKSSENLLARNRSQQIARTGTAAQCAVDSARGQSRGHALGRALWLDEGAAEGQRRGTIGSERNRPDHRPKRARFSAQRIWTANDGRLGGAGREDDRAQEAGRRTDRWWAKRWSSPARWKNTAAMKSRS